MSEVIDLKHHLSQVCHTCQCGGEKTHTQAQFGSLFKLHICADHKKRPVKALPGKPQQPVCVYKHTHRKYRETHKVMCDLTTRVCPTHTSMIILPCTCMSTDVILIVEDKVNQQ